MTQKAAVSGTVRRLATAKWVEIKCAFCGGTGKDPFKVLSPLSNCGVCGGKGTVRVKEPYETCPACLGTGGLLPQPAELWRLRRQGCDPRRGAQLG